MKSRGVFREMLIWITGQLFIRTQSRRRFAFSCSLSLDQKTLAFDVYVLVLFPSLGLRADEIKRAGRQISLIIIAAAESGAERRAEQRHTPLPLPISRLDARSRCCIIYIFLNSLLFQANCWRWRCLYCSICCMVSCSVCAVWCARRRRRLSLSTPCRPMLLCVVADCHESRTSREVDSSLENAKCRRR